MNEMFYDNIYGNARTLTFSDIWTNEKDFVDDFNDSPFSEIEIRRLPLLFYLLYSRYGNSSAASSDINRFRFSVFSIIYQYGPQWEKELDLQAEIRALSVDEIQAGKKYIMNQASNPSVSPTTAALKELPYINNQNTQQAVLSKVESYGLLYSLLKDDMTEKFISRFRPLFLTVAAEVPLLYTTQEEDND